LDGLDARMLAANVDILAALRCLQESRKSLLVVLPNKQDALDGRLPAARVAGHEETRWADRFCIIDT